MNLLRALAAPGSLALLLFTGARPALQSGRGLMHGYVAFDDFTYNQVSEGAIQARIELGQPQVVDRIAHRRVAGVVAADHFHRIAARLGHRVAQLFGRVPCVERGGFDDRALGQALQVVHPACVEVDLSPALALARRVEGLHARPD